MFKLLSILFFLAAAFAAQARENRSAPFVNIFGANLKKTSSHKASRPKLKSLGRHTVRVEVADRETLLLAKYGLLGEGLRPEILNCNFCDGSLEEYRLEVSSLCKPALSRKVDSRVSEISSILLTLNGKYSFLQPASVRLLKSFTPLRGGGIISQSLARLHRLDQIVSSVPLLVPQQAAVVTSHFGARQLSRRKLSQHNGTDMTSYKMTVHAAADGVVISCSWVRGYGNILTIDHGGLQTRYAHLNRFYVKPGALVKQGEKVALEGSTGRVRGRHLHFEVLLGGKHIDPINFIAYSMSPNQVLSSQAVLLRQKARYGHGNKGTVLKIGNLAKSHSPKQINLKSNSSQLHITKAVLPKARVKPKQVIRLPAYLAGSRVLAKSDLVARGNFQRSKVPFAAKGSTTSPPALKSKVPRAHAAKVSRLKKRIYLRART